MPNPEHVEKIRQAIMRYRELLDLLQQHVDQGNQTYARWFKDLPAETANLHEKERQREAALLFLDDTTTLRDAASHMRFICREFEREFEQLHDNLWVDDTAE